MAGCCCAEACMAAVLIGVVHLPGCPFDSAWCLVCEVRWLTVDWVDCRCLLSFVFLGGAGRLELSPCKTGRAHVLSAEHFIVACTGKGMSNSFTCHACSRSLFPEALSSTSSSTWIRGAEVSRCQRFMQGSWCGLASHSPHRHALSTPAVQPACVMHVLQL